MLFTFTQKSTGKSQTVTESEAERAILELCGGGYTDKQTADAMLNMAKLRNGRALQLRGLTINRHDKEAQ